MLYETHLAQLCEKPLLLGLRRMCGRYVVRVHGKSLRVRLSRRDARALYIRHSGLGVHVRQEPPSPTRLGLDQLHDRVTAERVAPAQVGSLWYCYMRHLCYLVCYLRHLCYLAERVAPAQVGRGVADLHLFRLSRQPESKPWRGCTPFCS